MEGQTCVNESSPVLLDKEVATMLRVGIQVVRRWAKGQTKPDEDNMLAKVRHFKVGGQRRWVKADIEMMLNGGAVPLRGDGVRQ